MSESHKTAKSWNMDKLGCYEFYPNVADDTALEEHVRELEHQIGNLQKTIAELKGRLREREHLIYYFLDKIITMQRQQRNKPKSTNWWVFRKR